MKALCEIVKLVDVITTSGEGTTCCDFGCGTDLADLSGNI